MPGTSGVQLRKLNAIVTSVANENRPPPTSAESVRAQNQKAELHCASGRNKRPEPRKHRKKQQQLKKLQEKKNSADEEWEMDQEAAAT